MSSKPRSEYTVSDIIRLRPKWFFEQTVPNSAEALAQPLMEDAARLVGLNNNLEYIAQMIDLGMNRIAGEKFLKVFGTFDISAYLPRDINRKLGEALALLDVRKAGSNIMVSDEVIHKAVVVSRSGLKDTLDRFMSDLNSHENSLATYRNRILDTQRSIAVFEARIPVIREEISDLRDLLAQPDAVDMSKKKIIGEIPDDWALVAACPESFTVVNREPITMVYSNAGSGMNRTLYMGFYALEFSWGLSLIRSYRAGDNIYVDTGASSDERILHPHLHEDSVCFGNRDYKASEYRKEKDVGALLSLILNLLRTYCPDNPYRSFSNFHNSRISGYSAIEALTSRNEHIRDIVTKNGSDALREHMNQNFSHNLSMVSYVRNKMSGTSTSRRELSAETQRMFEEAGVIHAEEMTVEKLRELAIAYFNLPEPDEDGCLDLGPDTTLLNYERTALSCIYAGGVKAGGYCTTVNKEGFEKAIFKSWLSGGEFYMSLEEVESVSYSEAQYMLRSGACAHKMVTCTPFDDDGLEDMDSMSDEDPEDEEDEDYSDEHIDDDELDESEAEEQGDNDDN